MQLLRSKLSVFHLYKLKLRTDFRVIQMNWKCLDVHRSQNHSLNFVRPSTFYFRRGRRSFIQNNKRDKLGEDYKLIYSNKMNRYYFWGQICIYPTIIPSLIISASIFLNCIGDVPDQITNVQHPIFISSTYLIFSLVLLIGTNNMCRRGILRIYYHQKRKEYVAIVQQWNMLQEQLKFTVDDVKQKPLSPIAKSMKGNVIIKGRPFFLSDTDFKTPDHFNHIMQWVPKNRN